MFKKIMNTMMTLALTFIMTADVSWGEIFSSGNSLFFFGEPEYPTDK